MTIATLSVLLRSSASATRAASGRDVPPGFLVMSLGGRRFGLPLRAAVRVEKAEGITPLPGCPDEVVGLTQVENGGYLPVFDPGVLLGVGRSAAPRFLVFIEHGAARAALALDEMPELKEQHPEASFAQVSSEELLRRAGTLTH